MLTNITDTRGCLAPSYMGVLCIYERGADKSLGWPRRKQATAQKILMFIYPIYNHNRRNILLLLQSALQPLVGFRPAQLSLSILSRKVLQSAVPSGTSNPQLGGGGILVLFIYIARLASKEIFSPSNKIHREVGRAKDLSAPRVHKHIFLRFIHMYISTHTHTHTHTHTYIKMWDRGVKLLYEFLNDLSLNLYYVYYVQTWGLTVCIKLVIIAASLLRHLVSTISWPSSGTHSWVYMGN
jgi:hypothetical protein